MTGDHQRSGLTQAVPSVTRNTYREVRGRDLCDTGTFLKVLPLHLKILEVGVTCKFYSTLIAVHIPSFKIHAFVRLVCLRSIWKILAENTSFQYAVQSHAAIECFI